MGSMHQLVKLARKKFHEKIWSICKNPSVESFQLFHRIEKFQNFFSVFCSVFSKLCCICSVSQYTHPRNLFGKFNVCVNVLIDFTINLLKFSIYSVRCTACGFVSLHFSTHSDFFWKRWNIYRLTKWIVSTTPWFQ